MPTVVLTVVALALGMNVEENAAFQQAQALYKDLEFEDAAAKFQAVADAAEGTPEDRATALVWVGMCFAGTGEEQKARDALGRALELHADLELPEIAPPKVRQIVEEKRAELEAARLAAQATVEPLPEEPTETEDAGPPPGDLPLLLISGGATAALGVVTLGAGGVLVALSLVTIGDCNTQADAGGFQSDVGACLDTANTEVGAGIGLAVLGVALAGVGGALLAVDLVSE